MVEYIAKNKRYSQINKRMNFPEYAYEHFSESHHVESSIIRVNIAETKIRLPTCMQYNMLFMHEKVNEMLDDFPQNALG